MKYLPKTDFGVDFVCRRRQLICDFSRTLQNVSNAVHKTGYQVMILIV